MPAISDVVAVRTEPQPDSATETERAESKIRVSITYRSIGRGCGPITGTRYTSLGDDYFIPVIDVTIARGSRFGQRPASTWTIKSPTRRLNWSGSSRLIVWPQFGITDSAAGRNGLLHQQRRLQAGPVLVPGQDQGRHGQRRHLIRQVIQRRAARPARQAGCCGRRLLSVPPSWRLNSSKPRGSLFSNCTRVGP